MSNLIQNYANTTKKYYNNLADSNSDNLLKPLDGKGYLVENNLLTVPKEFAKDSYYTTRALKRGISGEANDHELGKLNDLGLKIGGLMIATYLMTKRQTPKAKAMEFIGFGTFLASMALWPKIALQLPAKLIHKVDFRKQYVDEQGRKKFVSQDPNYIPFDLFKGKRKTEDLSAIADHLEIPKTDGDRLELAKDHVRKVSTQNNTLWMLTAGTATPIMTALASNLLEKHVGKFAEKHTNKKINNLAYKIDEYLTTNDNNLKKILEDNLVAKNLDISADKNLANILEAKKGSTVTQKDVDNIAKILTQGLDTQTQKAAQQDLRKMLTPNKISISNESVSNILKNISTKLDNQYGEGFTNSFLNAEKLSKHVDDFMANNGAQNSRLLSFDKADELSESILNMVHEGTKEGMSTARKKVVDRAVSDSIQEIFEHKKVAVLTDDISKNISDAGTIIRKFRAFDETISKASHFKIEKAPETILGNNWGEVTDTLIKELGISHKELKEAQSSEELTAQLFTRKLEALVKNEDKYKKAVTNISQKMAELDVKLDNPTTGKNNVMDILRTAIVKNCENTANELSAIKGNKPFENLIKRINGKEINGAYIGTIREAKVQRITQARVGGATNAYHRLLHTMDFFKRAEEYSSKGGFSGDKVLDEAIIAKGKKILMSGHSGDFFLKHQTANNVSFYKAIMWHTFESGNLSDATKSALSEATHQVFTGGKKTTMAQRITEWGKYVGELMGKSTYDFLPKHITDSNAFTNNTNSFKNAQKTAVEKFNKIACTPDNLLYNALKQKYNSKTWMRTWCGVGATVLGITLLSQLAFGKKDSTIQKTK